MVPLRIMVALPLFLGMMAAALAGDIADAATGRRRQGRQLRARRLEAGLTQVQLAEIVGCSNRIISRLERGEIRLRDDLGRRIDQALTDRSPFRRA